MKCYSEQDLNAFVDGELAEAWIRQIADHVEGCAHCHERVVAIQRLGEMLRDAPASVPSLAAQSRWMNANKVSADRSVRRLASWMTAAASIVLMVTLFMSSSQSAQATAELSDWEATAIVGPDAVSDSRAATAQLIAFDLSLSSPNEGVR